MVATRIREVLARDSETPPVSASIGIATYNGNGERIEKLLSEADQHLYAEKAQRAPSAAAAAAAAATAAVNARRRAQKA
jgi:GGDEF domain-containing protein